MCGIAGAVDVSGSTDGADLAALAADLVGRVSHRGPDGAGLLSCDEASFAHRRLAIHDLSERGLQPMVSADGALWLIVNGTIHNAPDLRAREEILGTTFRSQSDSEVLLALYRRRGAAFLAELRGPFALAIYDRKARELLLARDRAGEKPLFWTLAGRALLFASEQRALLDAAATRTLHRESVLAFLQAGFVPPPDTLVSEIRSVAPASLLAFDESGPRAETWWTPPLDEAGPRSPEECSRLLEQVLKEAVFLRTRAERPMGVLLSGGLDSAAVLAFARECGAALPAFTLGFGHPRYDERRAAAATAAALGAPLQSWTFDREPGPYLQDLVATTGEPLADASWLAASLVCEKASRHATVLLTGDGGDELLLGYRRHGVARWASRLRAPALRSFLAASAPYLPGARSRKLAAALASGAEGAFADCLGLLPRRRLDRIFEGGLPSPDPLTRIARAQRAPSDGAAASALWDLVSYLPGDLLPKIDRASMRHGVETWAPFLDPNVMTALLRMPAAAKRDGRRGKLPLRRALGSRLPSTIARGRKRGFAVPLLPWLRHGSYGTFARGVLSDVTEPFRDVLPGGTALPWLERCRQGEDELAPFVHACVVLALWWSRFVGR